MIPMTFSYILTVSLFFFLLFLKYSPSHSVIKIPTPLFSKITCTLLFLSVAALLSHGPFLLSWLLELLCYIFTSEGLSLGNFARVGTCNVCLSQSGLFHSFWFFFFLIYFAARFMTSVFFTAEYYSPVYVCMCYIYTFTCQLRNVFVIMSYLVWTE